MQRREFLGLLLLSGLLGRTCPAATPGFQELSESLCDLELDAAEADRVRRSLNWSAETPEMEVLLAWYTDPQEILEQPLAWRAVGFACPPTVCSGNWWDPPSE